MDSSSTAGLTAYLGALRRRRRLMALIAVPIAVAALVIALALPDRYSSSSLVSIEQQRLEGVRSSTRSASDDFVQEYVRSLGSALLSEKGLEPAVKQIPLYPDLKGAAAGDAAAHMVRDSRIDMVRSTILDPMSGREREIITGFRVVYTNSDPQLAFKGAT